MSFSDVFPTLPIENWVEKSLHTSQQDLDFTLRKTQWGLEDLPALLSPLASSSLENIAQQAHHLTLQRFGHVMQLFIPLYISNVCYNSCSYCGFSMENDYKRITLNAEEILKEGLLLKEKGFQHVLILTGEAEKSSVSYIAHAIKLLHPYFASIGIEIQPLSVEDYDKMRQAGADSLTVYQETYHPEAYAKYHKAGKKKNFSYRLDTPERGGEAEFYRINIGALMGLYDWRYEAMAVAFHLHYLQKHYWKTKYSVSFPRIRDMVGKFTQDYDLSDAELVQLICAFRLIFPDCGITLSTREAPRLRDHLIPLGITTMSAESNTAPGGYSGHENTEKQFEISDHRSLEEIKTLLLGRGYEPVMKDWDRHVGVAS